MKFVVILCSVMKQTGVTLARCSVCGKLYRTGNAKVVGNRNNSLIVHIQCENCGSATMTIISRSPASEGTVTMGMLTDLDYDEAVKMMNMKAIDADEVLDIIKEIN